MPAIIGLILALAVAAIGRLVGFDRDRAFYPVVLIVVAHYYLLFAVMAGGEAGLAIELAFFALFAGAAILGFRTSLWLVAAGLAVHGVFDFTRELFVAGNGAPIWWPSFCAGFDVAAALVLGAILMSGKRSTIGRSHEG